MAFDLRDKLLKTERLECPHLVRVRTHNREGDIERAKARAEITRSLYDIELAASAEQRTALQAAEDLHFTAVKELKALENENG